MSYLATELGSKCKKVKKEKADSCRITEKFKIKIAGCRGKRNEAINHKLWKRRSGEPSWLQLGTFIFFKVKSVADNNFISFIPSAKNKSRPKNILMIHSHWTQQFFLIFAFLCHHFDMAPLKKRKTQPFSTFLRSSLRNSELCALLTLSCTFYNTQYHLSFC